MADRRPTAAQLIAGLGLAPLPGEGGYYRETYRSDLRFPGRDRAASTAIYYFLTPDTFSALHRLPTDEVYHFYLGDPVELLQLGPDGGSVVVLGPDVLGGQRVQTVVRAGVWQGSMLRPGGSFALMGTTMTPGFDFADYEPAHPGSLIATFPEYADRIHRLCLLPRDADSLKKGSD